MKSYSKLLSTLTLSVVLFLGCSCTKDNETIITINDKPIKKLEYQKAFDTVAANSMFTKMGLDVKNNPNSYLYLMIKERIVNELIVKHLLDEEIKAKKIKVTNEDVEAELKTIIDKVGSKDRFNDMLKQNGVTSEQFKKDLTEEVKIKKLLESVKTIKVTDADAKKFYDENKDKFKYPDKVRASHILISANEDEIKNIYSKQSQMTEEELKNKVKEERIAKREKAKKILTQIKADKSMFEKLAKENSDDLQSAKNGGDLGFFAYDEMVEQFSKAAFNQTPNTISEIVETPYGYHIIMVTDRVKSGREPFEKVKEEIKNYLTSMEQVKVLQGYVDKLKSEATIKYVDSSFNPENIQKQIKEAAKQNPSVLDSQTNTQKEVKK